MRKCQLALAVMAENCVTQLHQMALEALRNILKLQFTFYLHRIFAPISEFLKCFLIIFFYQFMVL